MPKYKIVASKSQKKYTLIVSADSEVQAREKLHKEEYSILSIALSDENLEISGKKFLFQVEKNGEIKNGIIIGDDIFKVYVKLKDELGYNIIFLYPEGDEAQNNAQKKQEILDKLAYGYTLQKQKIQTQDHFAPQGEESFYLKKELESVNILIEKVLSKIEYIQNHKEEYDLEISSEEKLARIHESIVHMKGSTNLVKLKEIGELALVKIAELELRQVEQEKNEQTRELLKSTNELLKKVGSKQQFRERDKDIGRFFKEFFENITQSLQKDPTQVQEESQKKSKNTIDTQSYSFLKTVLLLEKYEQKLKENTQILRENIKIFYNPFFESEFKTKHLLKRKVIEQNISLLQAKKTGNVGSYTSVKKGYVKLLEGIYRSTDMLSKQIFFVFFAFVGIFFAMTLGTTLGVSFLGFYSYNIIFLFVILGIYILLRNIRNFFLFAFLLVFFSFFSIFSYINF